MSVLERRSYYLKQLIYKNIVNTKIQLYQLQFCYFNTLECHCTLVAFGYKQGNHKKTELNTTNEKPPSDEGASRKLGQP